MSERKEMEVDRLYRIIGQLQDEIAELKRTVRDHETRLLALE